MGRKAIVVLLVGLALVSLRRAEKQQPTKVPLTLNEDANCSDCFVDRRCVSFYTPPYLIEHSI